MSTSQTDTRTTNRPAKKETQKSEPNIDKYDSDCKMQKTFTPTLKIDVIQPSCRALFHRNRNYITSQLNRPVQPRQNRPPKKINCNDMLHSCNRILLLRGQLAFPFRWPTATRLHIDRPCAIHQLTTMQMRTNESKSKEINESLSLFHR